VPAVSAAADLMPQLTHAKIPVLICYMQFLNFIFVVYDVDRYLEYVSFHSQIAGNVGPFVQTISLICYTFIYIMCTWDRTFIFFLCRNVIVIPGIWRSCVV
jgi:hypothetical protein